MKRTALVTAMAAMAMLASPVTGRAQGTATVCKDGTPSAVSGRGACSSHGGVDAKATKAAHKAADKAAKEEAKEAKAAAKKASEIACTDGSMSKPGRGACSRHGGIKGSAAAAPAPTAAP
ncbi:MAG: hypothetical protein ABJD07_16215, partial [Gemmatimonadaceae bacterium]